MKQMLPKPRSPSCQQACILFSMQRNMILPVSVVHESFISKMSFYPELINQVELEKGTDFPLSDLMEKIDPHAASRKEKHSEKAWAGLWVLVCVSQREVCSHTIGCVQGCSLLVPWYLWRVHGRGLALLLWIRCLLCCLTSPSEGWAWYEQFTFPIAKTAACMKLLNLPANTTQQSGPGPSLLLGDPPNSAFSDFFSSSTPFLVFPWTLEIHLKKFFFLYVGCARSLLLLVGFL